LPFTIEIVNDHLIRELLTNNSRINFFFKHNLMRKANIVIIVPPIRHPKHRTHELEVILENQPEIPMRNEAGEGNGTEGKLDQKVIPIRQTNQFTIGPKLSDGAKNLVDRFFAHLEIHLFNLHMLAIGATGPRRANAIVE
jgi:hypothetical protein